MRGRGTPLKARSPSGEESLGAKAEGIYLARFDLQAIRAYRQRETLGNAYRKPSTYAQLISSAVAETFIRGDARR